jgi:hypothetical protein
MMPRAINHTIQNTMPTPAMVANAAMPKGQ